MTRILAALLAFAATAQSTPLEDLFERLETPVGVTSEGDGSATSTTNLPRPYTTPEATITTDASAESAVTSTGAEYTCNLECDACVAEAKRAIPASTGTSHSRIAPPKRWVVALDDRSLVNIHDADNAETDRNKYVIGQMENFTGDKQKLDFNVNGVDAVSLYYNWTGPSVSYVSGLVGCTGIVMVSNRGVWMAHLMETSFFYDSNAPDEGVNADRKKQWEELIIGPFGYDAPTNNWLSPKDLSTQGDILENTSNNSVRIFISTPMVAGGVQQSYYRDASNLQSLWRYADRVNDIINELTGPGKPWAGITPNVRTYAKPDSQDEVNSIGTSAYGSMMVEYDNDQTVDFATQKAPVVPSGMFRVWREVGYYEDYVRHFGHDQCAPNSDGSKTGATNNQLKEMTNIFCEHRGLDFNVSQTKVMTGDSLSTPVSLDAEFRFNFTKMDYGDCTLTCADIFNSIVRVCSDDYTFSGTGSALQECGLYQIETILPR